MTPSNGHDTTMRGEAGPHLATMEFFEIDLVNEDLDRIVRHIEDAVILKRQIHVLAINPQLFLAAYKDDSIFPIYQKADMVLADGIGVALAGGVQKNRCPKQYSGIDVMVAMCKRAATKGYRIFLLGGVGGIAEVCAQKLKMSYPGLIVAGTYQPPVTECIDDLLNEEIILEIRQSEPDIIFVGLGGPKQELWISRARAQLPGTIMMGVGGSFDILGGRIRRAPQWMRSAGLEWLFRLALEPRRLASRYIIGIPHFFLIVLLQRFRRHSRKTA